MAIVTFVSTGEAPPSILMPGDPAAPEAVTEILEAIDGAYERTLEGLAQAERGEVLPLEDLSTSLEE